MNKAVIFNRASRDPSGRAKSVTDQNKDNHIVCAANDWEVAAVFTENNVGASKYSKKKRSEYGKMLDFLQTEDDIYVLVCWEGSRNDRTLKGHVELSGLLQDTDTKLCIGGRLLDLNNDDDEFFAGLDALLSVKEAARLRKRTLRGVKSNALAGKPHARPPYGYRAISKGMWVIDEPTASVVRDLAERIARGESGTSLAKDLNRRAIPIPTWRIPFTWKEWSYAQVRQVLINPAYIAKRVYRGEVIGDAVWPALLDEDLYWTVYNKLTDQSRKTYREGGVNHLCSGQVASCSLCSSRLRFHTIKGIEYYVCADKGCVSMKYETLNDIVRNRVVVKMSDPATWVQILSEATNRDAEVANARTVLSQLQAELNDSLALVKARQLSVKNFAVIEQTLLSDIEAAKKRASVGINPLLEEMAGPNAAEVFEAWTLEQKREAISTLYEIKLLPNPEGKRLKPEDRIKFFPKGIDRGDSPNLN